MRRSSGRTWRNIARSGAQYAAEMLRLTPLVEPVSIDETFLDLGGTEKLHGAYPAQLLAALARRIEDRLAITVSIGLSDTKFLAKLASNLASRAASLCSPGARQPSFSPASPSRCCGGLVLLCTGD